MYIIKRSISKYSVIIVHFESKQSMQLINIIRNGVEERCKI